MCMYNKSNDNNKGGLYDTIMCKFSKLYPWLSLKAYFHSLMYCDCFSYEWYLDLKFQTDSADIFSFYNDRVDLNCFSL